jgi:hypothetical protein
MFTGFPLAAVEEDVVEVAEVPLLLLLLHAVRASPAATTAARAALPRRRGRGLAEIGRTAKLLVLAHW